MRPRVYVAGPYSYPSITENVAKAIDVGHRLIDAGYAPLVPHLTHFMQLVRARCYEDWIEMDLAWVAAAHAVLRLPGRSPGADREVALALSLGIPVFYSLEALIAGLSQTEIPNPELVAQQRLMDQVAEDLRKVGYAKCPNETTASDGTRNLGDS